MDPQRSFALTTAAETLALDRGIGRVSYTISNIATKPVRGRARLVGLGGAKEAWLSVDGDSERDFGTN